MLLKEQYFLVYLNASDWIRTSDVPQEDGL